MGLRPVFLTHVRWCERGAPVQICEGVGVDYRGERRAVLFSSLTQTLRFFHFLGLQAAQGDEKPVEKGAG
jgi:hypothetical protein